MKITDKMIDYWNKLGGKDGYNKLKASGLFYEIFPELTGVWKDDKKLFEPKSKLEEAINYHKYLHDANFLLAMNILKLIIYKNYTNRQ